MKDKRHANKCENRLKSVVADCSKYQTVVAERLTPELRAEWRRLWMESADGEMFNSVECFEVLVEAFEIEKFRIVTCRLNGKLCGILPLVKGRLFFLPVMTAAGRRGNYIDRPPLLLESADRDLIHTMLSEAGKLGILYLPEVHETSIGSLVGDDTLSLTIEPASVNRQVEISENLDTLRFMSSRQRRKIRSVGRSESGLRLHMFEGNLDAGMEVVIDVEKRSSKARRHMAFFNKPESRRLLESYIRNADEFLHIVALYHNDRPIATSTGFICKGVYSGYHSAYDETYKKYAPGKELVYRLMESLKRSGCKKADFLRGDSTVKKDFASDLYQQYDVLVSNSAIVLTYWKAACRVRNFLKKAVLVIRSAENDLYTRFTHHE